MISNAPQGDPVRKRKDKDMSLKVETMVLGSVGTNTYLVYDETTGDGVLVDPADQGARLLEWVKKAPAELKGVLLTHGHFDHIYGLREILNTVRVRVFAGEKEQELMANPAWNLSAMGEYGPYTVVPDEAVRDNDVLSIGSLHPEVIETPGHTVGSVSYYFKEEGLLFSGDCLFMESVGRTDLPTGNSRQMADSVKKKLLVLPGNVIVYSGHGPKTTIEYERRNNPFAHEDYWA